jgi:hypothetical protein
MTRRNHFCEDADALRPLTLTGYRKVESATRYPFCWLGQTKHLYPIGSIEYLILLVKRWMVMLCLLVSQLSRWIRWESMR